MRHHIWRFVQQKTELLVSFSLHDKCLLSIITASLLPLMSCDMLDLLMQQNYSMKEIKGNGGKIMKYKKYGLLCQKTFFIGRHFVLAGKKMFNYNCVSLI
ncbi:hypothetical protein XENOCAPTIV_002898 [Xenoophorus captivus]|uniref:Uncharacterized protein n=1 Tax=Xenoophorus captivus TaxID=1517983 RepID=A0ABV0S734_9TELE